jgi:magnesium transporter
MIAYYYKSLRSAKVQTLSAYKHGCWVHVEDPTPEEVIFLEDKFGLDPGYVEDAIDIDEMPRLEKEDDKTYIFVRYSYKHSTDEPTTVPLLFVFNAETVITISRIHPSCLDGFVSGTIDFATTQRTKLVLQILEQIVDQYDEFINGTNKQIKIIRSRLRGRGISNQDFIDFVAIEDELNEFLGALIPTNATLGRLSRGRYVPLFEEDEDLIEDLLLNNEQSVEACNSNIKSIENIREAYSSINANNLNRTMKYLTAATVLIAVPNLYFGMYGMNLQLPYMHEAWAFFVVLGLAFTTPLVIMWLARRKLP